jgi:uncharacterized RDD family membrane protein YckC
MSSAASPPTRTVASIRRRGAAGALDLLLAFTPCWLAAPLFVALFAANGPDSDFVLRFVLYVNLLLSVGIFLVRPIVLRLASKPTLGRKVFHVETASSFREGPAAVWQVLVRQLTQAVLIFGLWTLGLYPLLLIDYLWALVDRDGRTIHDLVARTVTVSAPKHDVARVETEQHT